MLSIVACAMHNVRSVPLPAASCSMTTIRSCRLATGCLRRRFRRCGRKGNSYRPRISAAMAAWKLPETLRGEMAALVSVAAAVLVQATLLGPFEKWRQRIVQRRATAASGGGSAR